MHGDRWLGEGRGGAYLRRYLWLVFVGVPLFVGGCIVGIVLLVQQASASGGIPEDRRLSACEIMGYPTRDCEPVINRRFTAVMEISLQDGAVELGHMHKGHHHETPKVARILVKWGRVHKVEMMLQQWPDYYLWPRLSTFDEALYTEGLTPDELIAIANDNTALLWQYADGRLRTAVQRRLNTTALPVILKVKSYEVVDNRSEGATVRARMRVRIGLMEPYE